MPSQNHSIAMSMPHNGSGKIGEQIERLQEQLNRINDLQHRIPFYQDEKSANESFRDEMARIEQISEELEEGITEYSMKQSELSKELSSVERTMSEKTITLAQTRSDCIESAAALEKYLLYLKRQTELENCASEGIASEITELNAEMGKVSGQLLSSTLCDDVFKLFSDNAQRLTELERKQTKIESPPTPEHKERNKMELSGSLSRACHDSNATATITEDAASEHRTYDGVLSAVGHGDDLTASMISCDSFPMRRPLSGLVSENGHEISATASLISNSQFSDI